MSGSWHTADYILLEGRLRPGFFLRFDEARRLKEISETAPAEHGNVLQHEGILSPGFINAHCHLELSHLKGAIAPGSGMTAFGKGVVSKRNQYTDEVKTAARSAALKEAWDSGAQAILDIANDYENAAKRLRQTDEPFVFSFLEVFGLSEQAAHGAMARARTAHSSRANTSAPTPHAPYSVLPETMRALAEFSKSKHTPISIHFMESAAETEWFARKSGDFAAFFHELGVRRLPGYDTPLSYLKDFLPQSARMLFVHCAECGKADIQAVEAYWPQAYFCLCPRSNVYIHNKLPDFSAFDFSRAGFGTDSLGSNYDLELLEEVKAAQKQAPNLDAALLLNCLTAVPARFMRWDNYGTFNIGAETGLINVSPVADEGARFLPETKARRIL